MNGNDFHKLIIIGCGASGMAAAISAAVYCDDILILERNDTAGKKLPATGNGKCNFTNLSVDASDFRSSDSDTAFRLYNRFNNLDVIDFFNSLGVLTFEKNGYCYPHSQQAASIRDVLWNRINEFGIRCEFGTRVKSISKDASGKFVLDCKERIFSCEKLISAAGGEASPCFGTDGSMYYLTRKLGHSTIEPIPALVGLSSDFEYLSELAGVRHEATVNITGYSEYGEIIFSKTGVSGIPVMNSSRFALSELKSGTEVALSLDFFPDKSVEELTVYVQKCVKEHQSSVLQCLIGLLNTKLISVILKLCGINPDSCERNSDLEKSLTEAAKLMKCFKLRITGSTGFENAQTTAGGVPLSEINPETLESKLCPGLYFSGELLDVDGKCGGYNLQWAWTTGVIAGAYAGGGSFDKSKLIKP